MYFILGLFSRTTDKSKSYFVTITGSYDKIEQKDWEQL